MKKTTKSCFKTKRLKREAKLNSRTDVTSVAKNFNPQLNQNLTFFKTLHQRNAM